jgi:hypothetical protein
MWVFVSPSEALKWVFERKVWSDVDSFGDSQGQNVSRGGIKIGTANMENMTPVTVVKRVFTRIETFSGVL